jgi:uncharacterized membrane protein YgcG
VQADLVELARHPAANYAMQMLFKVAPGELLGLALPVLFSPESIVDSCMHENANFVIQTFLEVAPMNLCVAAVEQMFSRPEFLIAIGNNRVGNNAIQAAVRACPNDPVGDQLCDAFADPQVLRALSKNKHGMHCLRGLLDVRARPSSRMCEVFWANWLEMSNDCSANLCVTAFIVSCPHEELRLHVHELAENILPLSTHTYANHVVQTWIERISQMTNEADMDGDREGYNNDTFASTPSTSAAATSTAAEEGQEVVKVVEEEGGEGEEEKEKEEEIKCASSPSSSISLAEFCANTVVQGIQSSLFELSMDKHGAFVVCTALRAFDRRQQCAPLVDALCRGTGMLRIARTQYGCQLLQKWSEIASAEQLRKMSTALSRNFAATSRDKFGNHFVLKMITFISPNGVLNTGETEEHSTRTAATASDASAGQISQKDKATSAQHSEGLTQLCYNLATLAEHQHASHVVQRVCQANVWCQLDVNTRITITRALCANISRLSHHKLGMHVARKAFQTIFGRESSYDNQPKIKELLMAAFRENFQQISTDQHGCRMVTIAMGCRDDALTETCVLRACVNIQRLVKNTHGTAALKAVITYCHYRGDGGTKFMLHRICKAMSPHAVAMAKDRHGNLALQAAIRQTGGALQQKHDRRRAEAGSRGGGGGGGGRGGRSGSKSPVDRGSGSGGGGGTNRTRRRNQQRRSRQQRNDNDVDDDGGGSSSPGSPSHGYSRIEHGESTSEPCRELVLALSPHVVPLALDWFGNRVVQALIECLPRTGPDADLYMGMVERLLSRKTEMEQSKYAAFVLKKLNDAQRDRDREAQWAQNGTGERGARSGYGGYNMPSYPTQNQYGAPHQQHPQYGESQRHGMPPQYGEYSRYGPGAASMLPLDANYGMVQVSPLHSAPNNYPPTVQRSNVPSPMYQMQGLQGSGWGRPAGSRSFNPASPSAGGAHQTWRAPIAVLSQPVPQQQRAWPAPQWAGPGPGSGRSGPGEEASAAMNGIWSKPSASPQHQHHQHHQQQQQQQLPAQHALHPLSAGAQSFSASTPAWSPNQSTPSQSPDDPGQDRGQRSV